MRKMMSDYQKNGVAFLHYRFEGVNGNISGTGLFRLDTVECLLDDQKYGQQTKKFAFTTEQLKRLLRSFKHETPHFIAFLPKNMPKRDKFREILAKYDTEFVEESS